MAVPNITPNLERLHTFFAAQPSPEFFVQAVRVEENRGADLYANFGRGLEVVWQGECTVIRGVLGNITVGDMKEGAVITISFDGDSPEPTSFLRWDKTRRDNGEGFSIPKRQRDKIAGHLIDRLDTQVA